MQNRSLVWIIATALLLSSCEPVENRSGSVNKYVLLPLQTNLGDSTSLPLARIIVGYMALKDAFAADNPEAVITNARKMRKATSNLILSLPQNAPAELGATLMEMQKNCSRIAVIRDKSCELQRISFKDVSQGLLVVLKTVDLHGMTIYLQYCPMAFNDTGAKWLSMDKKIRNPYFGKKMLESGEIVYTFK